MSCTQESHAYIIFGATGNLSRNKLLPSLYQLDRMGYLADDVRILCCGRSDYSQASWQDSTKHTLADDGVNEDEVSVRFLKRLDYLQGSLTDADFYSALKQWVAGDGCSHNVIFYLSVSPNLYIDVTEGLAHAGLLDEQQGWRRMVIEKPFGHDLESARHLQHKLEAHLKEEQIYRIDHYIGKEAVQNLLVLRFANMILEPLWNRHYIEQVQITHSETVGVEGRASYYDRDGGAMRDMIQSHLLQVMTLLAMEPPVSLEAEALRDEKVKVLKSVHPIELDAKDKQVVRAQYVSGEINTEFVSSYREEQGVEKSSHTETYTAMKLYVDNWRWRGVPFYLRTGKRLGEKHSMVAVQFKKPPMQLFQTMKNTDEHANWLLVGIQPDNTVRMEITAKLPGLDLNTRQIAMNATVDSPDSRKANAYEELLLDVIQGDRSLFLRYDEVKAAWQIVDPVMQHWAEDKSPLHFYSAGSWGPEIANDLFDVAEHDWRHTLSC